MFHQVYADLPTLKKQKQKHQVYLFHFRCSDFVKNFITIQFFSSLGVGTYLHKRAFLNERSMNIARIWKEPRCPSADEWIRKLWYIYTMEYYSAIKKNSFESVLIRWMKLEPIIQSEVSQKDKDQYSILTHVYGI